MPTQNMGNIPDPIRTWEELARTQDFFHELEKDHEWVFRGTTTQRPLRTTLEQVASEFAVTGDKILDLEVKLIHEFIRRYHLYSPGPPPRPGDTIEWLGLMRHYGAPCRLLDCSFSFVVAAFFSLERKPTVWAINKSWLTREVDKLVSLLDASIQRSFDRYKVFRDGNGFRKVFLEKQLPPLVCPVSSYRMNERLTIQQGLFLCPSDVSKSFDTNLRFLPDAGANIMQIRLSPESRADLLAGLNRANISRATLFPGLDGFAASLWTRVAFLKRLKSMEDAGARSKVNLDIRALRRC